jgi:hypothetical protein
MRKWDEPPSTSAPPATDDAQEGETVVRRARAFRKWLARGADPGGLRALAGEQGSDRAEGDDPPGDRA